MIAAPLSIVGCWLAYQGAYVAAITLHVASLVVLGEHLWLNANTTSR